MLNLKRWERAEHNGIEMELKRLRFDEAMPLMAAMADAFAVLPAKQADDTVTPREQARLIANFYNSLPMDRVAEAFRKYVRNVRAPEISLDGELITTGEQLFEVSDANSVFYVMTTLQGLAGLQSAEGKGSESGSTSEQEPRTPDGLSDATATEPGVGTALSTAQETQPTNEPSLNLA